MIRNIGICGEYLFRDAGHNLKTTDNFQCRGLIMNIILNLHAIRIHWIVINKKSHQDQSKPTNSVDRFQSVNKPPILLLSLNPVMSLFPKN